MKRIRGDGFQEAAVLFVSSQLRFAVSAAGDEDGFQADAVFQDKQVGIETQLPVAVLHLFRDQDLEAKVHASAAFRHIAEAGGDLGGIQGFMGHHFSVLVFDGFHNDDLPAFRVFYHQGIPVHGGSYIQGWKFPFLAQRQLGRHLTLPQLPEMGGRGTSGRQEQESQQEMALTGCVHGR